MSQSDTTTPRRLTTYRASPGWKVAAVVLGLIPAIGGLAGVWYFGTGHEVHGRLDSAILVGGSLIFVVFGVGLAAATLFSRLLVLGPEELRVPGVFRTQVLPRRSIVGYRVVKAQYINVLVVESRTPRSDKLKKTRISLLFKRDAAFNTWFRGIPDLDADDLAASVRDVEADARLGASPRERLEAVGRARKVSRGLHLALLLAGVWIMVYPKPYEAAVLAVAVFPWLALGLCLKFQGSFVLDDAGRKSAKPDLIALYLMPGFLLMLRALSDVHLVAVKQLIVPTLLGLAAMVGSLLIVAPAYRQKVGKVLLLVLLLPAYPASVIAIANAVLDHRQVDQYLVEVLQKRRTTGKGASQYLTVPAWGSFAATNELSVPTRLYESTAVGESVTVLNHPGAFGMPWYSVVACNACSGKHQVHDPVMARKVTEGLAAAMRLEIPSAQDVTGLMLRGEFDQFEERSKRYEVQFSADPLFESPLIKLYQVIGELPDSDGQLLRKLDEWVQARPSYMSYAARGAYKTTRGYAARGGRAASETSADKMEQMQRMHEEARADLVEALRLNSKFVPPYSDLIRICQASGSAEDAERVANKGVLEVPVSYYIRFAYIQSLRPKWGGSIAKMRAFSDALDGAAALNPRIWSLKGDELAERADIARRADDDRRAIALYSEALEYGDRLSFLESRANLYADQAFFDLALADYKRYQSYSMTNERVNENVRFYEGLKARSASIGSGQSSK